MKSVIKGLAAALAALLLCRCASLSGDAPPRVPGRPLPADCRQAVVAVPDSWDTSHVKLVLMEREGNDGAWKPVTPPCPARLGRNGSVWGLGISPVPSGGRVKAEGDGRTPAGIFGLDHLVYAYDPQVSVGKGFRVSPITPRDLWVEDPASPLYNTHVTLNHEPASDWEKSQQMKQNDPAHKIKLFIHHNSPADRGEGRPVPRAGSSIFFHVWREDGRKPTAGCTAMSESDFMRILRRLDASKRPAYIMLPRSEYARYEKSWRLPPLPGK